MKNKNQAPGVETRTFLGTAPKIEERADGKESRKVVGYAAVFEKWSKPLGWFKEKIARGAFDDVLNDPDTVAVFNHNTNLLLGRNGGTLKLSVDETGLRYEFEAPNNTAGNDLLESLERKDVRGSSFKFIIKKVSWEQAPKDDPDGLSDYRTIEKVAKLYDVGPVVFPAYPDADVAKRSRDDFYNTDPENTPQARQEEIKKSATARARHLRLININ